MKYRKLKALLEVFTLFANRNGVLHYVLKYSTDTNEVTARDCISGGLRNFTFDEMLEMQFIEYTNVDHSQYGKVYGVAYLEGKHYITANGDFVDGIDSFSIEDEATALADVLNRVFELGKQEGLCSSLR